MKKVQIRQRRRLVEGVEFALQRALPVKGSIYAKLGDEVKPETIIGEAKVSAGFRVISLAQELGVKGNQAKKYLRRTVGSRVYAGDVLAEGPGVFGLKKKLLNSPIDGVIQSLNEETGQLTMQFAPVTYRLPAGVRGKISQIVPDRAAYVTTAASLLYGVYSSGRMREGALRVVAEADQMITAQMIESHLAGYIIAGGSGIGRDALNRAVAVGVKGVVTGGIAAVDLLAVSGSLRGKEDVGMSLLITSGLGNRPMDRQLYEFLEGHKEQQAFLLPDEQVLVCPLSMEAQSRVTGTVEVPEDFAWVEAGDTVRVVAGADLGAVGVVKDVVRGRAEGSRLEVDCCLLQVSEGATIEVPVGNLELIA